MTLKEAIREIKNMAKFNYTLAPIEVFDMAIKALEQESKSEWEHDHEILKAYSDGASGILDKIRAEIEDLTYYWCEINPRTVIDDVLEIIDKYKAESEEGAEE